MKTASCYPAVRTALKKATEVKHIILQETRNKDDISLAVAVTARNSKNMNIFHALRKNRVTELEEEERLHFNSTKRNSNGPNVLDKLDESKREHGESNRDCIPRSRHRDEEDKSVTNSDSSDSEHKKTSTAAFRGTPRVILTLQRSRSRSSDSESNSSGERNRRVIDVLFTIIIDIIIIIAKEVLPHQKAKHDVLKPIFLKARLVSRTASV